VPAGPHATPAPPPAAPAPATPAPTPRPTGLLDAAWLREQPTGRYTIQVLGLSELQALRNYARDLTLQGDVAWFRTQRNGADWYVLVVGNYPDADAARAAIATLPAEVRRNQPWVRTFGSIQQAMSQAR
jgi:DamX protein